MAFEEKPADPLDRYSRQVRFPGMGEEAQRKLMNSRVTLCCCGTLGTALPNYLVRDELNIDEENIGG